MLATVEVSNIIVPAKTVFCEHCGKSRNVEDCKAVSKSQYSSLKGKYVPVRLIVCDGACSQFYENNARIIAAKRKLASRSNPFNRRGVQW